jgi:hypothetical protein
VDSPVLRVTLAAVPDTPTDTSYQDFPRTTGTSIKVLYPALSQAQNGGSPVLGYDLWRDDGLNGNYFRLYTADNVLSLVYFDTNVLKNRVYRFKYRARNINSWGDFSSPGYIFAANLPNQPAKPALKSVNRNQITI